MKDVLPLAGLLAGLLGAGLCLFARKDGEAIASATNNSAPAAPDNGTSPANRPEAGRWASEGLDIARQLMALALGIGAISFVPLLANQAGTTLDFNLSANYTALRTFFLLALTIGLGFSFSTLYAHSRKKLELFWLDSIVIGGSMAALLWWLVLERQVEKILPTTPVTMPLAQIALAISCILFAQSVLLRPSRQISWTNTAAPALLIFGTGMQAIFSVYLIAPFGGKIFAILLVSLSLLFIGASVLVQARSPLPPQEADESSMEIAALASEELTDSTFRQIVLILALALPCLTLIIGAFHLSRFVDQKNVHEGAFAEFWWGPVLSVLAATRLARTLFGGSQSTSVIIRSLAQTVGTLREQLNRRTRQITTLHAVTADFSNALDVERLMFTAVQQMRETLDAPLGAIWLRMDDANLVASQANGYSNGATGTESSQIGSAAVLLREIERSVAEKQAIESLRSGEGNERIVFQPVGRRWRQVQVQGADQPEWQLKLQILHDALEMGDIEAGHRVCESHPHLAGHALIVPIAWKGETIGALGIIRNGGWEDDERTLIEALATEVGGAMLNAQLFQEASRLADRDALTDLLNHRTIQMQLSANLSRAMRTKSEFSVVMMDVKNFKFFNDTYGHSVGDQVLRTVARCLTDATRNSDVLGRFGGDEFMAILLDTDSRGTIEVCSRIAERLQHESFQESNDGRRIPIAISFGAAHYPDDGKNVMDLLAVAQSQLEDARYGNTPMLANLEKSASQETQELRRLKEASEGGSFGVLDALVTAIDNKDRYTRRHSEDVTHWAMLMAKQLGFSEETQRAVRISGLLHDVGKIAVPDSILRKPGRLNDDEFQIMQQHPVFGALIVKEVPNLQEVLGGIRHHHERYDGRGYPDKLSGENIPVLGRLLAVPDCFSAMTTERPYRKALSWAEAITEIDKGRGTQFDPVMADAFLEVIARIIAEKSGQSIDKAPEPEDPNAYHPNILPRSVADVEKVS